MATLRGNLLHTSSAEVLNTSPTKIAHIIFTGSSSGDSVALKDRVQTGNTFVIKAPNANETVHIDLSTTPAFFPNGITVASISASCTVTIVITQGGAS